MTQNNATFTVHNCVIVVFAFCVLNFLFYFITYGSEVKHSSENLEFVPIKLTVTQQRASEQHTENNVKFIQLM